MVSIDKLVKIFNNFGDRENLSPLFSADEELSCNFKLTPKQVKWLQRFVIVWDYTQERDYEKWKNKKT